MSSTIKYQVFISSTFQDLEHERAQVMKAVLELGHIPVGMEMFSAADDDQWKVIARQIDEADFCVLLLAHRYGSTTREGLGYTEKEYDYAASKGVPILGFVLDEKAPWSLDKCEKKPALQKKLQAFRNKVRSKLVNHWTDKNDLHAKICPALVKAFRDHQRAGWVRAVQASAIAGTLEANQFGAASSLNVDIYHYSRTFTQDAAQNLASEVLRFGMLPRVMQHVEGTPDCFFIGSLVTAAEVRAVLSKVNSRFLRYLLPPDSPDSEGGDLHGRRIGIGYDSAYNLSAQLADQRSVARPVSSRHLKCLLDPKLTNAQMHRLLFEISTAPVPA